MKILFLKNHCDFRAGDEIESHLNERYLVRIGVAVEVKDKKEKSENVNSGGKKEKVQKNKNGTNK